MSSERTAIGQLLGERSTGRRFAKPAALTVLTFGLGAGLLGLAGWFIAASAVAGLTAASTFSFLFPSAGVQALAWARTLGRYGERISTHQATLDLVGSLRTSLVARALRLPRDRAAEMRSTELLGRITVDSDAVENLLLRSSFPILAALAALIGTAAVFASRSVALAIVAVAGLVLTCAVLVGLAHQQAGRPARRLVTARADARHTLIEALDGLPELRSFGAEQRAAAVVTRQLESVAQSRRQLTTLAARGQSVGTLLTDLTLLALVRDRRRPDRHGDALGARLRGRLPRRDRRLRANRRPARRRHGPGQSARRHRPADRAVPRRHHARTRDPRPRWWALADRDRARGTGHRARAGAGRHRAAHRRLGTGKSTILRAIGGQPAPASTLSSPASTPPASTPQRSPSTSRWSPRTRTSSTAPSATTSSSPAPPQVNPSSGRHSPPPRSTTP